MTRYITDDALAIVTLWMEARGQPFEGKRAVAEVIRNRMRLRYMSDGTVAGTVLRAQQFSCWNSSDPQRIKGAQIDDSHPEVLACAEAWSRAKGPDFVLPGDAVMYLNPAAVTRQPAWAQPDRRVAVIGAHSFYRDPGA